MFDVAALVRGGLALVVRPYATGRVVETDPQKRRWQPLVQARPGPRVAAVLGQEETDVVALRGTGDEGRLHVHDRRVTDEGTWIDHAAGTDLKSRDLDIVRGAVVDAAGEVVDAGLGERWASDPAEQGEDEREAHGRVHIAKRTP